MNPFRRARVETPCRIAIEHSADWLEAHVELADDIAIRPGDRVRVSGAPVSIGFGERASYARTAVVERAGWATRAWTRFVGHFALTELYEVSFSGRRLP